MAHWFYSILHWDQSLTLAINAQGTPFWDTFIMLYTNKWVWIPLVVVLLGCIFKRKPRVIVLTLLAFILLGFMCDWITSSIIKPYFHRYRPTRDPVIGEWVRVVAGYRGGRFGFCSSHASNAFGAAIFTSLLFRKKGYTLTIFLWAALMSYTRLYLGVHYVMDIVVGTFLGLLFGFFCYHLYLCLYRRYVLKVEKSCGEPIVSSPLAIPRDYTSKEITCLIAVIYLTTAVLFLITCLKAI